jgi:hypothetical protein
MEQNKEMLKLFKEMAKKMASLMHKDLEDGKNVDAILDAYNAVCENEWNGVDYIFDFENNYDVRCLIGNESVTFKELYEFKEKYNLRYFYCDENHSGLEAIENICYAINAYTMELVARNVLLYVGRESRYEDVYEKYITKVITECAGEGALDIASNL